MSVKGYSANVPIIKVGMKDGRLQIGESLVDGYTWRGGARPGTLYASTEFVFHTCHFLYPGCHGPGNGLAHVRVGEHAYTFVGTKRTTWVVTHVLRDVKGSNTKIWRHLNDSPKSCSKLSVVTCSHPLWYMHYGAWTIVVFRRANC